MDFVINLGISGFNFICHYHGRREMHEATTHELSVFDELNVRLKTEKDKTVKH